MLQIGSGQWNHADALRAEAIERAKLLAAGMGAGNYKRGFRQTAAQIPVQLVKAIAAVGKFREKGVDAVVGIPNGLNEGNRRRKMMLIHIVEKANIELSKIGVMRRLFDGLLEGT